MGARENQARAVGLGSLERELLHEPAGPRIVYSKGQRVARADFDPDQPRDEHGEWSAGAGGSRVYKTAPVKAGSQHAAHYVKTIPGETIEGSYMGVRKDLIHEVHEFSGVSGLKAIVVRKDGIKVYKQTDAFKQHQADKKFARSVQMGAKLGGIREAYKADMRSDDAATREKATVLALIDEHCIRVGGSAAEERTGSRGATTIQVKHLHENADGSLSIRFPGKSDVRWNVKVTDPQLAASLRAAAAGKRRSEELFPHANEGNVNDYIRHVSGEKLTAKDFRTFHASVIARAELKKLPAPKTQKQLVKNEKMAIARTAHVLGHTPAVCKSSYINPRVLEAYEEDFHAHAA